MAGAPGEEQAVGELGGQDQVGRRRLPADKVGDAAEAEDGVAMVLDEPLGASCPSLGPVRAWFTALPTPGRIVCQGEFRLERRPCDPPL